MKGVVAEPCICRTYTTAGTTRYAAANGVSLSAFFNPIPAENISPTVTIVRARHHPEITSGWSQVTREALSPSDSNQPFVAVLWTLAPGGKSDVPTAPSDIHEFIYVVSGDVASSSVDATHNLSQGDSATLFTRTPNQWEKCNVNARSRRSRSVRFPARRLTRRADRRH